MEIVILNDDVLLTSLAPFLNVPDFVRLASACRKLRNMFLPLAFKTLSSDEITFSRFLNIFRDHPAALSQVRELVVTDHAASVSDVTTEIIQLVGSGLDRLTLFDRDKYEEEGLNQIFLEWVRLCPNVRTLDFNISNLSRRWWLSGGASSMAIAISELVHLEGPRSVHRVSRR
ncbi:hypothetical protein BC829DRAFT_103099 [Chytridium lagenaria]|nr:hypothetical protein BC829DRAFT_103099 [Chytridium lagenaria]